MSLGPLMIDLEGQTLSADDRALLQHPLIGGVILFSRNYASHTQISTLTAAIRAIRHPPLLIAVDHEGGRVQRFRDGFTRLPAMARLGAIYDHNPTQALTDAEKIGWLLATELRAVDVDFSFAPVLDLGKGISSVIGDRAFHAQPTVVTQLARALMAGMHTAGMITVGKHFPGHGSVAADSHLAVPIDNRSFAEIEATDLIPFAQLAQAGLSAVMPAHVIYPQVDNQPAGFSTVWLQEILRGRLHFQGTIFSDDISMAGAAVAGDVVSRARQALQAGCDMVLICNDRAAAVTVVEQLGPYSASPRLSSLYGHSRLTWETLPTHEKWTQAQQICYAATT